MKVISHRGNLIGKDLKRENNPIYVKQLLQKGMDVEVDVWWARGKWFLGHDFPLHRVSKSFLSLEGLWCHAKNQQALTKMIRKKKIHCFWHQNDDYTITSRGYIWTYPGKKTGHHAVAVYLPRGKKKLEGAFGVCTDYPLWWLKKLSIQERSRE